MQWLMATGILPFFDSLGCCATGSICKSTAETSGHQRHLRPNKLVQCYLFLLANPTGWVGCFIS